MRAHTIKGYDAILQVLNEPGCPLCTFLKNVQSKVLQEDKVEQIDDLCNAHAWALAAIRRTSSAAQIFLSIIKNRCEQQYRECSVCIRLAQEETLRTRELLASLGRRQVSLWMETKGILCLPHGLNMRQQASGTAFQLVDQLLRRRRVEIEEALQRAFSEYESAEFQHGGTLGKAAEFLVAQRVSAYA